MDPCLKLPEKMLLLPRTLKDCLETCQTTTQKKALVLSQNFTSLDLADISKFYLLYS